jgi:hypothetical protein
MYTVENLRTLAEIIRTVQENMSPRGSKMRVNITGVDEMEKRFHSKRVVTLKKY